MPRIGSVSSGLMRVREVVGADLDGFTAAVFTRIFAAAPQLYELFGSQLAETRRSFADVIDHVLEVVPATEGHPELVEFLAQLGRDHRKFGAESPHYDVFYRALMAEFAARMGPEWDEPTAAAVGQAMLLTTGVMRGAAEMMPGPATWTARVTEKYRISREVAVVRLIADEPLRFDAGQYVEVQIPQRPQLWRNLSSAIPPNPDGELEFHVRALPGGTVGPAIVSQTAVGDVWTFAQAHGTLQIDPERPALLIAAGTGLAPLRALLLDLAHRVTVAPVHIFYGTRHPGQLYDLASLVRLTATCPWLGVTAVSEETTDPWWLDPAPSPAEFGIEHLIGTLADATGDYGVWTDRQVLIAGPPAMIDVTSTRLVARGVRRSQIQSDPVH